MSGRSPILHADSFNSRTSLDSRTFYLSRPAVNGNTFDKPDERRDEGFEDVKLNDDAFKQQPKKKSFLSRFSETSNDVNGSEQKSHHFHIPGRRRGQSGSGQELGDVQRPGSSKDKAEVTVK